MAMQVTITGDKHEVDRALTIVEAPIIGNPIMGERIDDNAPIVTDTSTKLVVDVPVRYASKERLKQIARDTGASITTG